MNFYKHFIGDYARDTASLSALEHGVYRLMLDSYYATEKPLPADVGELYLIAKARTPAERRAVDKIAGRFFAVNGDGTRHNPRADIEIAEARAKSAKAKGSAELRWSKADAIPNAEQSDMRSHSDGNASQSQKPEESKASTANAVEVRDAVANLPDCPHEKLISLYHELLPECPRIVKWTSARQQTMRARWRDEALPNREKHRGYRTEEEGLTYWRRFFSYCAESKFLTGQAPGRDGKPPFMASLRWLIKDENFAKVIEGEYHR